jgi:hypothetical protein
LVKGERVVQGKREGGGLSRVDGTCARCTHNVCPSWLKAVRSEVGFHGIDTCQAGMWVGVWTEGWVGGRVSQSLHPCIHVSAVLGGHIEVRCYMVRVQDLSVSLIHSLPSPTHSLFCSLTHSHAHSLLFCCSSKQPSVEPACGVASESRAYFVHIQTPASCQGTATAHTSIATPLHCNSIFTVPSHHLPVFSYTCRSGPSSCLWHCWLLLPTHIAAHI